MWTKMESVESKQARHLAMLESRQAARREYLRSVKQLIELRQRELDNLRSLWNKESKMTDQILEPLAWGSDGFEYSADGVSGEFSLLPYNSPVDNSESWILRGRRHGCKDWRYFGSYGSLTAAQEWGARVDSQRTLFSGLQDEYGGECW